MSTFLAYFDVGLITNGAVFIATLVFAQKIKDFFTGVPADLRKGMKAVEMNILSDVKRYQASLVQQIAMPPTPAPAPAPAPAVKA